MLTVYAQPDGLRRALSVHGSSTEKEPSPSRVSTIGSGMITASSSSITVTVGVNVTVPTPAIPRALVYVPVTTRVTMSADQLTHTPFKARNEKYCAVAQHKTN